MATCIISATTAPAGQLAYIEELQVDREGLDGDRARSFLADCGLAPGAIEQALAQAGRTAEACGAAVLRVQLRPSAPAVSVCRPDLHSPAEQIMASLPGGLEPSRAALSGG
jgi:hypothetical protein